MELDSRHTSRHIRLQQKSQIFMFVAIFTGARVLVLSNDYYLLQTSPGRVFWFYQINSSLVSAGGNSSFYLKPGNTNHTRGFLFSFC